MALPDPQFRLLVSVIGHADPNLSVGLWNDASRLSLGCACVYMSDPWSRRSIARLLCLFALLAAAFATYPIHPRISTRAESVLCRSVELCDSSLCPDNVPVPMRHCLT